MEHVGLDLLSLHSPLTSSLPGLPPPLLFFSFFKTCAHIVAFAFKISFYLHCYSGKPTLADDPDSLGSTSSSRPVPRSKSSLGVKRTRNLNSRKDSIPEQEDEECISAEESERNVFEVSILF